MHAHRQVVSVKAALQIAFHDYIHVNRHACSYRIDRHS